MKLIYDYIDHYIEECFKPLHELGKDLDIRIRNLDIKINAIYKEMRKPNEIKKINNFIHL